MNCQHLSISDVVKVVPAKFGDRRGYFSEVFKDEWFRSNVADVAFVQDNQSLPAMKGTVRGLHFQLEPFAQGKLVRCIQGAIFDVAVDIRLGSRPTGDGSVRSFRRKMVRSCGYLSDLRMVSQRWSRIQLFITK